MKKYTGASNYCVANWYVSAKSKLKDYLDSAVIQVFCDSWVECQITKFHKSTQKTLSSDHKSASNWFHLDYLLPTTPVRSVPKSIPMLLQAPRVERLWSGGAGRNYKSDKGGRTATGVHQTK